MFYNFAGAEVARFASRDQPEVPRFVFAGAESTALGFRGNAVPSTGVPIFVFGGAGIPRFAFAGIHVLYILSTRSTALGFAGNCLLPSIKALYRIKFSFCE